MNFFVNFLKKLPIIAFAAVMPLNISLLSAMQAFYDTLSDGKITEKTLDALRSGKFSPVDVTKSFDAQGSAQWHKITPFYESRFINFC